MVKTASIAEIQQAGVTVEADEAVAIAQQLIAALSSQPDRPVEPPFGPPSAANVFLTDEGRVECRSSETTPAVSEIATLLQTLVPRGPSRVAGGLRYAIARALLDVDVPPFDSLEDFSETLARYERGPREQAVRRVLQRLDERRALAPARAVDRRRDPLATELRRALREADAQLYLQKIASEAAVAAPRPKRAPGTGMIAAGLLLIAVGEVVQNITPGGPAASPPPSRAIAQDISLDDVDKPGAKDRLVPDRPAAPASRPQIRREAVPPPVKRTSTAPRVSPGSGARRRESKGVLDKFKLQWLRSVFKADL
jgi:hypothetical protein